MRTNLQRFRYLGPQLAGLTSAPRLVILTGARQTGKTTLARATFPQLRYVNLDAVEDRDVVRSVRTDQWAHVIGPAILDEVQKEPTVFDKVKFAFDAGSLGRTVLLGSSQILVLQRVRETLAGRAFVYELWPLMASELASPANQPPTRPPLLDQLLTEPGDADALLGDRMPARLAEDAGRATDAIEHLLAWGGMPALLPLGDDERWKWLQSYSATYLERDLGDLARLSDLAPFRQFERLCALRSGHLLSYADLARDAGVAPATARRYLEYLRISYQAFTLPPFATNVTSSLVKSPKVYWGDVGMLRHLTGHRGPVTGPLFETLVVTEVAKWLRTNERTADLTFYRTRSGLEVDLFLSTAAGIWGLEVKASARLGPSDSRGLRDVARALGPRWRGGLVIYRGQTMERLGQNLWAVPVERLLVPD
jgi:predicted AAA+ superfamily ATPase